MQNPQRKISPLLYYTLISSLTNLAFLIVAVVLLAPFSVDLSDFGVQVLVFLLLWKGVLVGFGSWYAHKEARGKAFLVRFIGLYLGRFFGVLIGGFLGYRLFDALAQPDILGALVGALALYFAGRWTGSRVSALVGRQLDRVFALPETQAADAKPAVRRAATGILLYSVMFPFLSVVIGWLLVYFDIPIGYLPELLPVSRMVVIALIVFVVGYPWYMRRRWLERFQAATISPESVVSRLGLSLSVAPALYGMILFVGMGASIMELCAYALISEFAAILWAVKNPIPKA